MQNLSVMSSAYYATTKWLPSFLEIMQHDETLSAGGYKGGNEPLIEFIHHL
jgi:hypothetical protein